MHEVAAGASLGDFEDALLGLVQHLADILRVRIAQPLNLAARGDELS